MKYAFICFNPRIILGGRQRPQNEQIAILMDTDFEKLCFAGMCCHTASKNRGFFCYHNEDFRKLTQILEDWKRRGINSTVKHHFISPKVWSKWRTHVFFEDGNVQWQVLLENDDGTCSVYVHLDEICPQELVEIYHIAERMNPKE